MRRKDIVMTDNIKSFLAFDLGHMDESKFSNVIKDIVYSDDPDLKCDIYYPEEKKDVYPVFLIVYGGGWISGFKCSAFVEPMLKPLNHGYCCIVLDYTMSLDEAFPRSVVDIKKGIDFIHTHKDEYHLDDTNISIWGESAGAHLALEACLLPNKEVGVELNNEVKNMVIMYPLVNIETADDHPEVVTMKHNEEDSMFSIYLGPNRLAERVRYLASPIHFINEDMPNLWLQHGSADALLPYQQTIEVEEKVKDFPIKKHIEIVEGKGHTDPYFFTDENVARIIEFIEG
ncbi:MAG: alpha/beta hydrolase [Erysipelotrichaceae bacterium]|nr:alpha/beta hydrolase [Erysipelotrichaceae bacterium]